MSHRKLLSNLLTSMMLIPILIIGSQLHAQNEKETLRAMYSNYNTMESLQMNVSVQLFRLSNDNAPMQQSQGKVFKDGFNYYSEMMGRTTLINKRCAVIIDNNNKVLLYSEPEGKASKEKESTEVLPDSVLFGTGKLKTVSNKNNLHCIEIVNDKDAQYRKIEMTINTLTKTLERIDYYFKPSEGRNPVFEKMTIIYSGIVINGKVSEDIFSEKKYISVSRDKITGLGKYAAYEIIDQRIYNKQVR